MQHSSTLSNNNYLQPASFSFDNPSHIPSNPQKQQRSFTKCLRLKTNQSLQTNNNQKEPNQSKKSIIRVQDSMIMNEHCQRLAQEEYDLKVESLIKQYQLRLTKQEEYYGLREWKMKEEIQNLEQQNLMLSQELRRGRNTQKNNQQKCTLCGDGQVLAQYNKLLTQNQQNHKGCLTEKKQLTLKTNEITAKYEALQEQHEKVCQDLRTISKQLRNYKAKLSQLESQKDDVYTTMSQLDHNWKQKVSKLEQESRQLQRELAQRDVEINQMNQSKATVQSVLTNPTSLKSSSLRVREEKENYMRQRSSLSKMIAIEDDGDRECLKKLSQNVPRNVRGGGIRHQSMRWKYF